MFPFMQPGMQPPSSCEHEVMIHCVQALTDVNNNLMALANTISANATSIRKTLEAMTEPVKVENSKFEQDTQGIFGSMSFPDAPGVYAVQIDPSNPQAAFDIINDLIKKKFGGFKDGI